MPHSLVFTPVTKPICVVYTDESCRLPAAVRAAVEHHWGALAAAGRSFTRGDVFTICDVTETDRELRIAVALSDYAHYLATIARVDALAALPCRVIHTSVMIRTADGYLAFGEMAPHTSTPGRLQCAGGGITRADLTDGNRLDLHHNAQTELWEETGIDCRTPAHACTVTLSYLKQGGTYNFMGAMFVAETMLTHQSVQAVFDAHRAALIATGEKPELARLVFVKNNSAAVRHFLEGDTRPQEDYLATWLLTESAGL